MDLLLSRRSPSLAQKRLAASIAVAVFAAFIGVIPFKDRQWPSVAAFIPVVDTTLMLTDLITAVMLYAQFSVLRTPAVLALATGYLYTALIIIAHLLTFPGALAPSGLLGSNLQSTFWLYVFWHFGLPLAVILYTLLKSRGDPSATNPSRTIVLSVCAVATLVGALTMLATVYSHILPSAMIDSVRSNAFWAHVAAPLIVFVSLASLALLWPTRTSLLDTWLLVVLWAWFIEALLLSMTSSRFTLVWYAGRVAGLVSSSVVLLALLYEATMSYARLAASVEAQAREREGTRLTLEVTVGSIAHELRQPLTAIVANSDAGIHLLDQTPPDLQEARSAFEEIHAEGCLANDIIQSIQATLADTARPVAMIDVVRLLRETLTLLRTELQLHGITVQVESPAQLPWISGNKGQLLQVLLNLITNAVDSMREVTTRPRVLYIRANVREPDLVSISVEDSGMGIREQDRARVFDPWFTTKSHGTGLGLAICRSIITAHNGNIEVLSGSAHGALFQVLLPAHTAPG